MAENSGKTGKQRGFGRPFTKGISGNPGGRPKVIADIRDLARQLTPAAIETLAEIMTDKKASPAARVSAACAVLDRGWGKSTQSLEVRRRGSVAEMTDAELMEIVQAGAADPDERSIMAENQCDGYPLALPALI